MGAESHLSLNNENMCSLAQETLSRRLVGERSKPWEAASLLPGPPSGDEFVVFQRTERAALAEAVVLAHLEGTDDRHTNSSAPTITMGAPREPVLGRRPTGPP